MATEVESSSKLLCLVCWCEHMDREFLLDNYHIFIVDLNDADGTTGYVKMAPNLRLQGFSGCTTICNVGSDLYIFNLTRDRSVYKYTINAALKSEIVVQDPKLMVTKMPYPKLGLPMTIPSPDGKIVVLSDFACFYGYDSSIALDEEFVDKSRHELYDPETNVWKLLPELYIRPGPISRELSSPSPSPIHSLNFEVLDNSSGTWITFTNASISNYNIPSYYRYNIQECCFISESTLLVRVMSKYFRTDGHLFTLNIHSLEQGWKFFDEWKFCNMYPGRFVDEMLVVGNRLFLDRHGGIDISSKSPVNVELPRSDYSGKILHTRIAVTDYVEDKECCFAIVISRPGFGPGEAYLVVDEFKYDFAAGKCTPKIKNPFYFITAETTELFFITNAFMLPPAPILFKGARRGSVLLDDPEIGNQEKDSIFDGVGVRFGEMVLVSTEEDCRS